MKKQSMFLIGILFLSIWIMACGWNPEVTAVPVTEPWTAMNLPVKQDAIVWKSEPKEFRAVHKADKKTVTRAYTDALKAQGWELGKFDDSGDRYYISLTKGGEKMDLEVYDFSNTGVVLKKS
jgi:hypothetical protein